MNNLEKRGLKDLISGVIDPITIIGVLFLLVTLVVGTAVVKDRNISLNIQEKAAKKGLIPDEEWTDPPPKASKPNFSDKNFYKLEKDEKEFIEKVQGDPFKQLNKYDSPSESEIKKLEIQEQQTTNNNIQTCDVNGAQYNLDSVVVGGTGSGSSGYAKCTNSGWVNCPTCNITSLTIVPIYLQDQYNTEVQKLKQIDNNLEDQESAFIQGVIQQEQKIQAAIQTQIAPVNINPLANLSGSVGGGITPQQAPPPKFESKSECQASVNPDSREYNTCSQYATQEETKTTLLGGLSDLFTQFGNAFNNSEFGDFGTYGLGGGNAYVAPVPMNIINSENSSDFYNYAIGNTVSVGAGFATATLLTPGAPMFVFETVTAIPGVVQVLTLSDLADTAITGALCSQGNQEACAAFTAAALIPGPSGQSVNLIADSIDDFATSWAGTGSVVNKIINNIPSPALFNPSSSFDSFIPANTIPSTNYVDVGVSQADNYLGSAPTSITDGGLGFSQNYTPNPPNQTSVQLANLLDSAGINPSFPSVTANNLLDTVANSSLTGNPFPTTLEHSNDLANALDTPPTNTGGLFDSIFNPQNVIPETGGGKFTFEIPNASQISDWIENNLPNPIKNLFGGSRNPVRNVDLQTIIGVREDGSQFITPMKIDDFDSNFKANIKDQPNFLGAQESFVVANKFANNEGRVITVIGDSGNTKVTIVEIDGITYAVKQPYDVGTFGAGGTRLQQDRAINGELIFFENYSYQTGDININIANTQHLMDPETGDVLSVQRYIEGRIPTEAEIKLIDSALFKSNLTLDDINVYRNFVIDQNGVAWIIDPEGILKLEGEIRENYFLRQVYGDNYPLVFTREPDPLQNDIFAEYRDRDLPVESVESNKNITTPQTNSLNWFQENISEPFKDWVDSIPLFRRGSPARNPDIDDTIEQRWTRTTENVNDPRYQYNIDELERKINSLNEFNFDPNSVEFLNKTTVDGRLVIEVKLPNDETILMYRSSGTGSPSLKQEGDWIVINGFAKDGWFIKEIESTQLTKGGSQYLTDLSTYIKRNEKDFIINDTSDGFLDGIGNVGTKIGISNNTFTTLGVVSGSIAGLIYLDERYDWGLIDVPYDIVISRLNNAAALNALSNDKELSEIAISNPNQRPYDEVIQEAINNYTENNPGSDVYYESNPNAMSLFDIFKLIFDKNTVDIIYSTLLSNKDFTDINIGNIITVSKLVLANENDYVQSVFGAANNIGLFTKEGGTYPINDFDDEVKSLTILIEEEVQITGHPVSHSFVIEYFLNKNNGDLAQAILDSSNFEEELLRHTDDGLVDTYGWIQRHVLDEYSPMLPYQILPAEEGKLKNSEIYYDYSLPNRLGEVYHAANIAALLYYLPPEMIRAMTISEYLVYGEKHGLLKLSADLEVLKRLDNINDLLNSYK